MPPRARPAPRSPRPSRHLTPLALVIRFLLRRWWLLAACAFAAAAVTVFALFIGSVPLPDALPAAQSSTVLAADGSVLALYHGTEDRIIVPLAQISPNLRDAVVAAEDRGFFSNGGVSLRGTLRALWVDVTGGSIAQGGSTITQQYVRNAFAQVGRQRSIVRKLREATLAIKFERKYSKNKILEDYLNTVYFGRGAYGAEAAARAYFNKPAKDLSASQASYLAGIIRRPEYYQPDSNPQGAVQIRDTVLSNMVDAHYLTTAQADAARIEHLTFAAGSAGTSARAAYFVEYVRRLLKDQYHLSDQQILRGGLRITTTLDPRLQDAAEAAVSSTLNNPDDPQAALVALDVNGSVRAMVGGRDTASLSAAQGFNFAYQRATPGGGRQAGSAFKPFTLATFVDSGYSIDSTFQGPTAVEVTSRQCRNLDGSNWSVSNFKNETFGDLSVSEATAHSVNTIYAQIVNRLGPKSVASLAQRVGGWNNPSPVCSIALGTSAVTPLEMARAYATFAARGERPDPLAVTRVVAPGGEVLVNQAPRTEHALDANVADTVTKVLTQVLDHGTAAGKGIGRPAAGKTGTTENLVDAWFVGYTPNLSTAVWMGYTTDPKTGKTPQMTSVHGIEVSGGTLPATIWQRFMKAAVAGTRAASFTSPTSGGRIVGPPGAACAAGLVPTSDNPCVPPGSSCPPATATPGTPPVGSPGPTGLPVPGAAASSTGTAVPAPCPTPSETLPPDVIIPAPSPSPGASPAASPKALGPRLGPLGPSGPSGPSGRRPMSADGVEATEALPGSEHGSRSAQPPSRRPWRSRVRPGPPASLGVAIRAAAIGLVLAYLLKEPCTTHGWADFFQYRHLCYNDIQPLFHARGVDRALVPYRDIQVEYPVLIGAFMYVTGRLLSLLVHLGVAPSYNDPAYFQLSALALAPLSLAVTLLLRPRVPARRLMIWAVGTPTLLYSFLNWDLLAVAAMVWGVVEVERRRWDLAGLALALGTSAKLFPAFLVPSALLAAVSIGDRRGARRFVAAFAGALVVVNVPWMIASFSRWMGIWKFHATRYPDFGTIWFWVAKLGNRLSPSAWWNLNRGYGRFMGGAGLATFALVSCIVLWVGWQRRSEPEGYPVASTGLAIIAAFLVLSKVHSPQYALWIAPFLAMLDVPWWQVFAYMGADLVLFVSAFYWFTELSAPVPGWERIFEAAVFARGAVLLVMSVTAMKSARRLLPGTAPRALPAEAAVPPQP